MREIKFRMYDTKQKGWVMPPNHQVESEMPIQDAFDKISPNPKILKLGEYAGRYILMQYTGFKDKRREEIYEEDILRIDLGIKMASEIEESHYFYVKVYFESGCWMVSGVSGWKPFGYSDWTLSGTLTNAANEKVEVVGNVFENPELLK